MKKDLAIIFVEEVRLINKLFYFVYIIVPLILMTHFCHLLIVFLFSSICIEKGSRSFKKALLTREIKT
jgi:hypothetical protein